MNVISDVIAWLTDPAQWSGPDGIPVRTLQHLGYSLVATVIAIVFSYYIAILTFRFGLDPDNHAVPIITSVMDLAGVAVVLFVMTSLGVLPNG